MNAREPLAVGFDFDHTLGLDRGLERHAFARYAAEHGVTIDADGAVWRPQIDALLAAFRSDGMDAATMLARFADAAGIACADAARWEAICLALVDELVVPVPGAADALAALRDRAIPLAILTNGWSPLQERKIARALPPAIVDAIPLLVSDRIGAVKPARAAFEALAHALGVAPHAVWYVGDNARVDVGGALAAGMRAVWFDWEGQSYPADLPPPTRRITTLGELTRLAENITAP